MCQLIKLLRKNQSFIQFTQHIRAECLLCAKLCSPCSVWDYGNETWPYYSRDIREVTWTSCESPGEGGSSMSTPSTGQWKSQIFSFPARKVRLPGVKIARYGMSSVRNEIAAKEEQEGEWWIQGLFTAEQVFRRQQEEKVAGRKQVGKESTVRKDWTCFWDWAKCSRRERHMEWWVWNQGWESSGRGSFPSVSRWNENIRKEGYVEDVLIESHVFIKFRSTESRVCDDSCTFPEPDVLPRSALENTMVWRVNSKGQQLTMLFRDQHGLCWIV